MAGTLSWGVAGGKRSHPRRRDRVTDAARPGHRDRRRGRSVTGKGLGLRHGRLTHASIVRRLR